MSQIVQTRPAPERKPYPCEPRGQQPSPLDRLLNQWRNEVVTRRRPVRHFQEDKG